VTTKPPWLHPYVTGKTGNMNENLKQTKRGSSQIEWIGYSSTGSLRVGSWKYQNN
jgi:hypothetical protein